MPAVRRVLGVVLFVLAGTALVLFVLGLWNPWRYVVLMRYFSSPALGLVVVMGLACVASWVLLPVRNETTQRGRAVFRIGSAILVVVGLICWGLTGPLFVPGYDVRASHPDGDRAVTIVDRGEQNREMRVWAGAGLAARDVGAIGKACGHVQIRFQSRDLVWIGTSYGDWEIDLDPSSGRPLEVLGPHCADPPRPATLDR